MESIIKGLQILDIYNGKLKISNDLIKLEDFEISNLLKDDFETLKNNNWDLYLNRDGKLLRASYNTEKHL